MNLTRTEMVLYPLVALLSDSLQGDTLTTPMATRALIDELIGWPAAVGLLALGLLPEFLPWIFGTGEPASGDWSFIYVTCHFVLLPLCSLVVLASSAVFLVRGPNRGRIVLPALVAAGFIAALYLDPLPWLRNLHPAR